MQGAIDWKIFKKNPVKIIKESGGSINVYHGQGYMFSIEMTDTAKALGRKRCDRCRSKRGVKTIVSPDVGVMDLCYPCRVRYNVDDIKNREHKLRNERRFARDPEVEKELSKM